MATYKCERCGHATLVKSNMKGSPAGTYTCRGIPQCSSRFEARIAIGRSIIADAERDLRRFLSPGEARDLLKDRTDWSRDLIHEFVDRLWKEAEAVLP